MGMLKEFKEFAMKGNLIDIAVGFVMGAAFGKVTGAFINGMVMPVIGLIQGKDLSVWKIILKPATTDDTGKIISPEVAINYGAFISVTIEFIVVAFVMFLVVKGINTLNRKKEAAPAPPELSTQEKLLMEIRDELKK